VGECIEGLFTPFVKEAEGYKKDGNSETWIARDKRNGSYQRKGGEGSWWGSRLEKMDQCTTICGFALKAGEGELKGGGKI